MTGPEHYKAAENWAFKATHEGARGGTETSESCAAIAQMYATLALAAATALSSYLPGQDGMPMRESLAWLATCGEPRDAPCS